MPEPQIDRYPLSKLVEIRPGYPFRGKLPLNNEEGDAYVVQFRHIIVGERLSDRQNETLDRVSLPGRKKPEYLRTGDVVFMAKGTRNDAAVVGDVPHNTVCTPNFYHIRLKPEAHTLMPEFLAWQINHVDAQRYFAVCSQGSVAPSITKSQLAEVSIAIPPIEEQELMVKLADTANKERQLLNRLMENRQQMISTVGHRILHPEHTTENEYE